MRQYCNLQRSCATLGVDVNDNTARIAISFTNRRGDQFSRPTGKTLINLRFDATDETLRVLKLKRYRWSFPYTGDNPRFDILMPLKDHLNESLTHRSKHPRSGSIDNILQQVREFVFSKRTKPKTNILS